MRPRLRGLRLNWFNKTLASAQKYAPLREDGLAELIFPRWISAQPADPIARLIVQPQDFPFLAEVLGHDDEMLNALAQAAPDGFPWPAALKT